MGRRQDTAGTLQMSKNNSFQSWIGYSAEELDSRSSFRSVSFIFSVNFIESFLYCSWDDSLDGIPHVLALCGNSGCGKSTAMELLSSELEIELVHWNEDCWDVDGRSDGLYQQYRFIIRSYIYRIVIYENLLLKGSTTPVRTWKRD